MTPARVYAHPSSASYMNPPRDAARRLPSGENRSRWSRLLRVVLRGPTDMSEVTNGGLAILFSVNVLIDANDGFLSASSQALGMLFGRPEPICALLGAWGVLKILAWWTGNLKARRIAAYVGVFVWAWLAALSWDTRHASLAQVVFPWLALMSALTIIRLGHPPIADSTVESGGA